MTKNLPIPGKGVSEPKAVSMLQSPLFGSCIDSGGDGWYIKEVEEEDPRVMIVVIFYEPDIQVLDYHQNFKENFIHCLELCCNLQSFRRNCCCMAAY